MIRLAAALILVPSIAFGQCKTGVPCNAGSGLTVGIPSNANSGIMQSGSENLFVPADQFRTLTITKSKICKLIVLEDAADKIVIGCRAELGK